MYGKQSYCKLGSRARFTCSLPLRSNKPEQDKIYTSLRTANLHFHADSRFASCSFGAATVRWVVTTNTISLHM